MKVIFDPKPSHGCPSPRTSSWNPSWIADCCSRVSSSLSDVATATRRRRGVWFVKRSLSSEHASRISWMLAGVMWTSAKERNEKQYHEGDYQITKL